MVVRYRIDKIVQAIKQLKVTCSDNDVSASVPFTLGIANPVG